MGRACFSTPCRRTRKRKRRAEARPTSNNMSIAAIQVASVVKRYDGRTILDRIVLDVFEGETLVILGGSGSGKSTLLRLMIGNVRPDGGEIVGLGKDVCCMTDPELVNYRKSVGVLFQSGALFNSMTVAENVAL